jgi:hypothetical protein
MRRITTFNRQTVNKKLARALVPGMLEVFHTVLITFSNIDDENFTYSCSWLHGFERRFSR